MSKIVDKYIDYIKSERSMAKNTVSSYKSDIIGFTVYLSHKDMSVYNADKECIMDYLTYTRDKGNTYVTMSRCLAALRSFYNYLVLMDKIKENPIKDIPVFKGEKSLPQSISTKEIEKLLNTPDIQSIKGCRDKAILELMYATGIKVSDLIALKLSDINLRIGYICVQGTDKRRTIPIYAIAKESLSVYRDKRREINGADNTDTFFLNLRGGSLTRQGVWKIIKFYNTKSGIAREITPNTIRNSFAVHLLENGADIKAVQEMMGHTEITTTQMYERVIANKLYEVYDSSHPRAGKK